LRIIERRDVPIVWNARCAVKLAAVSAENAAMETESPSWAAVSPTGNTWHGRRSAWRNAVKAPPVIDISECSDCGTCIELYPALFVRNKETGLVEVRDLEEYSQEEIQKVMSYCPQDCIILSQDA
jgi:ferredoxin